MRAFVDTSGWAALFVQRDSWHSPAKQLFERIFRDNWSVVTTNYVLAELASLFWKPLRVPRPDQVRIIETLLAASWVEILHIDVEMDRLGWQLWSARNDKEWSFVDCVSFVVMEERCIREAVTTDHHFEQAGYSRLLMPTPT